MPLSKVPLSLAPRCESSVPLSETPAPRETILSAATNLK
jgi:hypothetical protein